MRKHPKRILSLLLALVLCLGLLPMTALAEEDDNPGLTSTIIVTDSDHTPPGNGGKEDEGDLEDVRVITDTVGSDKWIGDQPNPNYKEPEKPPVQEHTITFSANGGRFSDGSENKSVTTVSGLFTFTEVPTREGYAFEGWKTKSPNATVWPPETFVDRYLYNDTQLFAVWKEQAASGGNQTGQELNITFDANGGTFPDGSKTQIIPTWPEGYIMYAPYTPTREGYTFVDWGGIDDLKYHVFTANTTVKATWKAQAASGGNTSEFLLTLDFNDGTGTTKTIKLNPPGNYSTAFTPAEELPTPTRKGYTFLGWFRRNDVPYKKGDDFGGSETLTARWKKDGATEQTPARIDFFANGGRITQFNGKQIPALASGQPPYTIDNNTGIDQNSGILWTATDEYGNLSSIPVAARDGYTFDGWYKLTDASNFWDVVGDNYSSEVFTNLSGQKLTTSTVNKDSAMYAAKWTKTGSSSKDGEGIKPVDSTGTSKPGGTTGTVSKAVFADVVKSSPFAPAISWAVEKGITNGTSSTTFSPGTTCTRGHILTFLWRSQGSPEPTVVNPYKDEIPNAFQKAAVWAHEKGLVTGDTFGSSDPCTRASSVTYMWKLAGSPEAKAASFKDVAASSDYAKAVSWAVEQGVTNGTGDGTSFSPENTCTRGQIVTFLYRAYKK